MKKFFFLAVAMATSMFAQAQQIFSFGFEDADKGRDVHCQYSLTPRPQGLGDWVNIQEGDEWDEQATDEAAHSGTYGLSVLNESAEDAACYSWNRGFKLANLPIKENVPYRVSFWIKSYTGGKLSSWLSVGVENFDKSFTTADGKNYGLDQVTVPDDGEWHKMSFLTVYHGKEAIKKVIDGQSWVGNAVWPEQFEGSDGVTTYKEHFGGYIPETFFFIANMNSAGEYYLDDICIEENATVAGCSFVDGDLSCVKINFGFPTNISNLAKENEGNLMLPVECVTITENGEPVEIASLEAIEDGYLYAFLPEGVSLDWEAEIKVSFTPSEGFPVYYTTSQRPVAEEGNVTVLAFSDEVAEYDENIDAISSAWSGPALLSVTPEDESFELPNDFGKVTFTYNMPVSLISASVVLTQNNVTIADLTDKASLSEDECTIIVELGNLDDGEYTVVVSDVENQLGIPCDNPQRLTFSVGVDDDMTESEEIFCPDFSTVADGTFPKGWIADDNGSIHQYGFTANGEVVNYNWGGNTGGGGARMFTGFSGGDFTTALYWRSLTHGGYGSLTFGEQVLDFMDASGNIDPEMDPEVGLWLEPAKYQIDFLMAAWKFLGEQEGVYPTFTFTLEDLEGNIYAEFNEVKAKPCVNGGKTLSGKSERSKADFVVTKPGYYVLRYTTHDYTEMLLANVRLVTMPSKAAFYKQQLLAVLDEAVELLDYEAADIDESEVYKALNARVEDLQENIDGKFHSPSEVEAEIENVRAMMAAVRARLQNAETFDNSIAEVVNGIENLQMEDPKYMTVEAVAEAAEIVAKFGDKTAADLTDEELADAAPKVSAAAQLLGNVKKCTDILTAGIRMGIATYDVLMTEDDYALEAASNAVSDDREVAALLNEANKMQLYKLIVDGTWNAGETVTDEEGNESTSYQYLTTVKTNKMVNTDDLATTAMVAGDVINGIEMSGYVANPKMYRVNGNSNLPGWTLAANEDHAINIGWGGTAPSAGEYVTDQYVNYYGDGDYDLSQTITGLPVGVYAVVMATRTPLVDKTTDYERIFYYNAQDEEGNWDKYMYATVNGEEKVVTPFLGLGSYYGSHGGEYNTLINNLVVADGAELTIGLNEHYVSGQAMKHEDNTAQSAWTGTTMADDVHLYFVAPLEGYDYKAALAEMETAMSVITPNATVTEVYNVNGVRLAKAQKGINIVKMSNGKVMKVLVK